jgi:hypothetical protein
MTGESFHQIIPFTTQPAFEVFVSEFAKVYRDQKIVKIKDGAPWHRIQSPEPAIELSTLPADLPTGKPVSEPAYSHLS